MNTLRHNAHIYLILLSTVFVALLTGATCGSNKTLTLDSILIAPLNSTIQVDKTQQYMAIGAYADGSTNNVTADVTWSSSNNDIASIDSLGLARGKAAGSVTITAAISSVTQSVTLKVTPAPTLDAITVTPADLQLAVGASRQYTATASYSNGNTPNVTSQVTWASSNSSVATISAGGLVDAVAAGTTTISATLNGKTGNTTLTVSAPTGTLQSIAVTPANASKAVAATQQYTATGTYSDSTQLDISGQVTWASSSTGVATISTSGLATAVAAGSTTISATLGSVSGNTTLTVTAATGAWPPPAIPASHVGTRETNCNACHSTNAVGHQWPSSHNTFASFTSAGFAYTTAVCNTCHASTSPTPPPARPSGHPTATICTACHTATSTTPKAQPASHISQGFTDGICLACHT